MKRSRLFLGLTTACLAIAGVVAAKVAHFTTSRIAYYKGTVPNSCITTATHCVKAVTAIQCTQTVNGVVLEPLYTNKTCTTPFRYTGDND